MRTRKTNFRSPLLETESAYTPSPSSSMAKEAVEDTAIKEVALTAIAAAAKATLRSLTAIVAIVASMVIRQRTAGLSQTIAQKERVAKGSPKFTSLGSVFL